MYGDCFNIAPNGPTVWPVRGCRLSLCPRLPKKLWGRKHPIPLKPLWAIPLVVPSCIFSFEILFYFYKLFRYFSIYIR